MVAMGIIQRPCDLVADVLSEYNISPHPEGST